MKILYNTGVVSLTFDYYYRLNIGVWTDYTIVYLGQFWDICHEVPFPGCTCVLFRVYITN